MGLLEVILIAIGLAMDAFSVSICKGLAMTKVGIKEVATVGLWFGAFQAIMPTIGYFLGSGFSSYIENYDHWIAFGLLLLIGVNMIKESFEQDDSCDVKAASISPKAMIIPAIATSIDALAIGVAFAMVEDEGLGIGISVGIIGAITFIISAIGVKIGGFFGSRFKHYAERTGGAILILIGIKIVIEHLLKGI